MFVNGKVTPEQLRHPSFTTESAAATSVEELEAGGGGESGSECRVIVARSVRGTGQVHFTQDLAKTICVFDRNCSRLAKERQRTVGLGRGDALLVEDSAGRVEGDHNLAD